MGSTAADRIRAMKEKGAITSEQAEELLRAISENAEEPPPEPASREGEPEASQGSEAMGTAGAEQDESTHPHRRPRHSKAFFDMEWVGDMVDGITSGLGAHSDQIRGHGEEHRDDYRYEWDPRWGRQRGANAENASRVEQPEGESFEFTDNRVVFSKLAGLRLVRAKVRDNSFSASTLKGVDLMDSVIVDSSLAGTSVHDLLLDKSEIKDMLIAGSKVSRLELRAGSGMKNAKITGSRVAGLSLDGGSSIEDTRFAGLTMSDSVLSGKSRIKDTRLNGSAISRIILEGATLLDTRIEGCTIGGFSLSEAELTGCALRGARLQDSTISRSRIRDSRWEAVGFSALKIEGSELKNVVFRDAFDGRFPRKAERLSLLNVRLENVQFTGCTFRDTTIRDFSVEGVKIRGKDLSGRTIESADELRALAES